MTRRRARPAARALSSLRAICLASPTTTRAALAAFSLARGSDSGGGEISLEVSDIRCHLEDLGEPWPTRWRPGHAEAGPTPEPG